MPARPRTSSTYQSLDVETLGGHDVVDFLLGHGLEDGGFTGVVESEKEDFGVFVVKAEGGEGVVEPVDEEHGLVYYIVGCVGVVL